MLSWLPTHTPHTFFPHPGFRLLPLPHVLVNEYGVDPEIAMMAHKPLIRAFEEEAATAGAALAAAQAGPEEGELEEEDGEVAEEEGALPDEGECVQRSGGGNGVAGALPRRGAGAALAAAWAGWRGWDRVGVGGGAASSSGRGWWGALAWERRGMMGAPGRGRRDASGCSSRAARPPAPPPHRHVLYARPAPETRRCLALLQQRPSPPLKPPSQTPSPSPA
jgi:hypothetical protein